MNNKVRTKLIVDIEAVYDDKESSEETLRYCVEQDLEDAGFNVFDVSVKNEGKESFSEIVNFAISSTGGYLITYSDGSSSIICKEQLIEKLNQVNEY